MNLQLQLLIGAVIVLLNARLSKEILTWEPSLVKRIALVLAVWLIPVVGAVVAYKRLELDWFKKRSKKSSGAQNALSGAMLELDGIFNPGARHVIEAKQKVHIELSEDGQSHNNVPTNLYDLLKSQTSESSKKT